jgi:putative type II/III system pilus formation protein
MRTLIASVPLVLLALACGGNDNGLSGALGGPFADGGVFDGGVLPSDAGVAGPASIQLSQTDVHIPVGTMTAFAVTAIYPDGSRQDVTPQADAVSSNPAVATVAHGQGSQILITARSVGTATITVTFAGRQQTCAVTVTATP